MQQTSESHKKIFNREIVNQYVPESPPTNPKNLFEVAKRYKFCVQQYSDLLSSMEYAEKEILPFFTKDNLANVDHEKLIDWIKQLHKKAAKTLLEPHKVASGEYSKFPVLRWQKGANFQEDLIDALIENQDLTELLK